MKRVFLYGGVSKNFKEVSEPFIEAAGGNNAKIALLIQGGKGLEKFISVYRDPWLELGAEEVLTITADEALETYEKALDILAESTGVFVGGGNTETYRRAFAADEVGDMIRGLYGSGAAFGGVSAGALLASDFCAVEGNVCTIGLKRHILRPRTNAVNDYTELRIEEGLGLVNDCIVEAHFSEQGGFQRLIQSMELTRSASGLGIDEPACVEVTDESDAMVYGDGRVFHLTRRGHMEFTLKTLEPGDSFSLRK